MWIFCGNVATHQEIRWKYDILRSVNLFWILENCFLVGWKYDFAVMRSGLLFFRGHSFLHSLLPEVCYNTLVSELKLWIHKLQVTILTSYHFWLKAQSVPILQIYGWPFHSLENIFSVLVYQILLPILCLSLCSLPKTLAIFQYQGFSCLWFHDERIGGITAVRNDTA